MVTYTEKDAKAEMALAVKDLESVEARLRETDRRLRATPAYRKADAAARRSDDYTGVVWWLAGTCDEVARDLRDVHVPNLRADLKATEASLARKAAKAHKQRERQAAQPAPAPSPNLIVPRSMLAMVASALSSLKDPRVLKAHPAKVAVLLGRITGALIELAGKEAMAAHQERQKAPRAKRRAA